LSSSLNIQNYYRSSVLSSTSCSLIIPLRRIRAEKLESARARIVL
jgi:hypothetical protein